MKGERKGMMMGTSFGWGGKEASARRWPKRRSRAHQRQEGVLYDKAVGLPVCRVSTRKKRTSEASSAHPRSVLRSEEDSHGSTDALTVQEDLGLLQCRVREDVVEGRL